VPSGLLFMLVSKPFLPLGAIGSCLSWWPRMMQFW
jgi:hypothetical protein